MTPIVAVTQRVTEARYGERHDSLDQRWSRFLGACGLVPLLLPNEPGAAPALLSSVPVQGLVLTGGNTLASYGGDAPDRDRAELEAIDLARDRGLPILGVCRGMQLVLHSFGVALTRVDGHSATHHAVTGSRVVNSFHDFAAIGTAGPLTMLACAGDGVVEAVRHPVEPIYGVMWHPERVVPFADEDIGLFQRVFAGAAV